MVLQMTIDCQHTLLEILLATKTTRFPFRSFIVIKFALSPVEGGPGISTKNFPFHLLRRSPIISNSFVPSGLRMYKHLLSSLLYNQLAYNRFVSNFTHTNHCIFYFTEFFIRNYICIHGIIQSH